MRKKSSIDQTEISSSLAQQKQDQMTKNNLFQLSFLNQISKILTTNFYGFFLWQLQKP